MVLQARSSTFTCVQNLDYEQRDIDVGARGTPTTRGSVQKREKVTEKVTKCAWIASDFTKGLKVEVSVTQT